MTRSLGDHRADPAILHKDPLKRLDAIIRRHGGKPTPEPKPGHMVLPAPGKRRCKCQLPLVPTVREAREARQEDEP